MKTFVSVSIFSLPAILISFLPELHEILRFDRAALGQGQLWRLWTGHWVHLSHSHLGWNLTAMVLAATWLELIRPNSLLRFAAVAAPLLSLGLLALDANLAFYGGLSGVGTGVITLLGLILIKSRPTDRWMGIALLSLVAFKLAHDALTGTAMLSEFANKDIQTTPLAHALGSLLAVGYCSKNKLMSSGLRPPRFQQCDLGSSGGSDPTVAVQIPTDR